MEALRGTVVFRVASGQAKSIGGNMPEYVKTPSPEPRPTWVEHYPPGVPAEVDVHRFASLADMLAHSCRRYATRAAFTSMKAVLTYAELDCLTRDFASYLQRLGLSRGDRVAIMLPNLLQYPVVLFGILRAGMVVVNVNPLYTAPELRHQLADSGATAIVVLENFAHTLQAVLGFTAVRHIVTTKVGDLLPPLRARLVNLLVKWIQRRVPPWRLPGSVSFHAALRRGRRQPPDEPPLTPEDIALLQYTGGTTGIPKGAILSHGNLVANVEQISAWLGATLEAGKEVVVTPLPLHHIFALTANLLTFVRWGGNNVLITDPRDLRTLLRTLRTTRFSAISGVNTLFRLLLDAPGFAEVCRANAGSLKVAVAGGMAVQREVALHWQQATGIPLTEGYGLTEAAPVVCINPVGGVAFSGAVGMPLPSTRVAIRDETGLDLPPGQAGEICVQGPAGHAGLLEYAGGNGTRSRRRRVDAHRRHGCDGPPRQYPLPRAQQGGHRGIRLQGLPQGNRGCGHAASRHPGRLRHRRRGRTLRRGSQAPRGQARSRAFRRGGAGPLPRAVDRLQGSPLR